MLRRYRACLVLCGLVFILVILNFVYRFTDTLELPSYLTQSERNLEIINSPTLWPRSMTSQHLRVSTIESKESTKGKSSTESKESTKEVSLPPLSLHCNLGRLGNQMCTYASLYGISALNHRQPISLSCNIDHLKDIFVGPSKAPTVQADAYAKKNSWSLVSYLRPEDAAIPSNSNFLNGFYYPCSFTFFDHVRDEIRREFQFQERFNQYAQTVLHKANTEQLQNVTFVGVHVRRGDYNKHWLEVFEGVPVNMEYFRQAIKYFREKYQNVIFVAISDDRLWCTENLAAQFDVHVPEKVPSAAHDLAILANCNHTIMTYGTYGFWGGYLAGGEVLYFDKFLKPNTSFMLSSFLFDKMYPPYWKGIVTINVTSWFQEVHNNETKSTTSRRKRRRA